MKYRLGIDGLRALTVAPVIFFHADFELFSGGYADTGIFFVLSGCLIRQLLSRVLKIIVLVPSTFTEDARGGH
jgi:peptidoglycan/LPS O-acetylase OafA/YrhL